MSKTVNNYFDAHLPRYGNQNQRHTFLLNRLNNLCNPSDSLIDIGCGTGSTLELIMRETPLTNLYGMDTSAESLKLASRYCKPIQGSILERTEGEYDFAVLSSVLHHLVGRTRRESFGLARVAVENAMHLLKPSGHLFIYESVFSPAIFMDAVFYIKRLVTAFAPTKRIHIFKRCLNIGAPIISFCTEDELKSLVGGTIKEHDIVTKTPFPLNYMGIVRKQVTLVVRPQA